MSPGELWRRIQYLLNRARMERELQEEMAAHRSMKEDGEPRFGNTVRLQEDARDSWGWAWWDQIVQDVTFGSRMLRKSPAFTLTAEGECFAARNRIWVFAFMVEWPATAKP